MVDYGVDTFINGIPIGFYPYEQMPDGSIIQRSFSPTEIDAKSDLKIKEIPNIEITDYLAKTTLPNGNVIGISSLEVIKATKEKVGRAKDSITNMKSTLDDRTIGRLI